MPFKRVLSDEAPDVRRFTFIESLGGDIRYAARSLRKRPLFSAAVIATLALGLGATTTVFATVNAILLRSLPYRAPQELVAVWERDEHSTQVGADRSEIAPANLVDWQQRSHSFAGVVAYSVRDVALTGNGEPEEVSAASVTWSLFSVLGVRPLIGHTFSARDSVPESDPVVILSESLWRRRFGADTGIIGRSMQIAGTNRVVLGIIATGSVFPRGVEVWTPRTPTASQLAVRSAHFLQAIARLRPGVRVADAQAELTTIARQLQQQYPATNADVGINLVPLQEEEVGSLRGALLLLFGAVGFVMLVASANVGGLFMARSAARASETALRVMLGASRRRIVQQLLAESLMLSLAGAALGLLLAAWGTRLVMVASPVTLVPASGAVSLDGRVILFALGLSIIASVGFGVGPALAASATQLHNVLKQGTRQLTAGSAQARGRRLLVAGELALTMILLAGAGLMLRSLAQLERVDLGFVPSRLLTTEIHLPGNRYPGGTDRSDAFYTQLVQTLHRAPGVQSASAVFMLPFNHDNRIYSFRHVGRPSDGLRANFRVAMPGYFATIHVPIVRGRDLAATDTGEVAPVVVINEAMARRFWPGENAIGSRIVIRNQTIASEIVGIVRDMKYFGHDAPPEPEMYVPHAQFPVNNMTVVVRTRGDPAAMAGLVAQSVHAIDREVPVGRASTMTQLVDEALAIRRFTRLLLIGFAIVGLALSCIGLYGLIAYSVTQRTNEIGIRMALGARTADVLTLIAGEGARLAVVGVIVGTAGAFLLGRVLAKLVFGVSTTDPLVLITSAVVLSAAALLASAIPASRAARVNPVIALRGG